MAERRAWTADDIVELDLATWEKMPLLASLLEGRCEGPALDIGAGLGYYSRKLLAPRIEPTVSLDIVLSSLLAGGLLPCCGSADGLPFPTDTFGTILLTDVLEHCPDDRVVLDEVCRVLRPGGHLIVTVPSLEWGFPDFLDLIGVESVHEQEGPERHFTAGYQVKDLEERLQRAGLEPVEVRSLMRLGSKLMLDAIALVHLWLERGIRKRDSWTWGDLVASPPPGLRFYEKVFPLVRRVHWLLGKLPPRTGFELAVVARKG
ncbi:MAG: class I SAM-dependent methyltransferase [Acidobacteriota bacterium]